MLETVSGAVLETVELIVLYVCQTCIETGSKCAPKIVLELQQANRLACLKVTTWCHCRGVNSDHFQALLSQCQSVVRVRETCAELDLLVSPVGQEVCNNISYCKTEVCIGGFILDEEEIVSLRTSLKKHLAKLYLTHPLVELTLTRSDAMAESSALILPFSDEEDSFNSVARIGCRGHIASDSVYYQVAASHQSCVLQPLVGLSYKVASRLGERQSIITISASAALLPPVRYSKLKAKNKTLPADGILSAVKILVFGPGGLPLWTSPSPDPLHLSTSVAEWGDFGISLHPCAAEGASTAVPRTGWDYRVESEREGTQPCSEKRTLVLMVFVRSGGGQNNEMDKLRHTLDDRNYLQSTSKDMISEYKRQLKTATHSVLNRVFFNYTKEQQLRGTIDGSLPAVANAVATIIAASENEDFKRRCQASLQSLVSEEAGEGTGGSITGSPATMTSAILSCLNKVALSSSSLKRDSILVFKGSKTPQKKADHQEEPIDSSNSADCSLSLNTLEGTPSQSRAQLPLVQADSKTETHNFKAYIGAHLERKRKASQNSNCTVKSKSGHFHLQQRIEHYNLDESDASTVNVESLSEVNPAAEYSVTECRANLASSPPFVGIQSALSILPLSEPSIVHRPCQSSTQFNDDVDEDTCLSEWPEDSIHFISIDSADNTLSPQNLTFSSDFESEEVIVNDCASILSPSTKSNCVVPSKSSKENVSSNSVPQYTLSLVSSGKISSSECSRSPPLLQIHQQFMPNCEFGRSQSYSDSTSQPYYSPPLLVSKLQPGMSDCLPSNGILTTSAHPDRTEAASMFDETTLDQTPSQECCTETQSDAVVPSVFCAEQRVSSVMGCLSNPQMSPSGLKVAPVSLAHQSECDTSFSFDELDTWDSPCVISHSNSGTALQRHVSSHSPFRPSSAVSGNEENGRKVSHWCKLLECAEQLPGNIQTVNHEQDFVSCRTTTGLTSDHQVDHLLADPKCSDDVPDFDSLPLLNSNRTQLYPCSKEHGNSSLHPGTDCSITAAVLDELSVPLLGHCESVQGGMGANFATNYPSDFETLAEMSFLPPGLNCKQQTTHCTEADDCTALNSSVDSDTHVNVCDFEW